MVQDFVKEYFTLITMKTKNNKTLYLTDDKYGYKWTFEKANAIWFETEQDAEKFCKNYFKKFKNYEFMTFETYI